MKTLKPSIKPAQYNRLICLFHKKHWPIDEQYDLSYFDRYIRTLLKLKEEQQDFLIELSERFIHIPQSRYLEYLIKPVSELRKHCLGENLIFTCCLPKEDIGKAKSSTSVLYQFKGTSIRTRIDLGKHCVIDNFSAELTKQISLEKTHFVLVDDFVGTGGTALGAIDYIHELFPSLLDNSKISVLCIVAMQRGKEKIEKTGASVYASIVSERGISDTYSGDELDRAKSLMTTIEGGLKKLKDEYKFGYGQSEALVCMERCPNNTFPIYWLTKNDAPYER